MISAAPSRVRDRAGDVLELVEAGRLDPDLQRPRLEPGGELADPPWHPQQRLRLRVSERE
jgi:hypothetical protein